MVAAVVWLATLAGGCAMSSGKDFVRPDQASLALGQTTVAGVTSLLGPPTSRSVHHSLNAVPQPSGTADSGRPQAVAGTFETLVYRYSRTTTAVVVGPMRSSAKQLTLSFWNDRLVSYTFESGFDGERTDFEEGKAASFRPGQATRAEVVGTLGRPNGEAIYPYVKTDGSRQLTYVFIKTDSTGFLPGRTETSTTRRSIRFLFDPSDRLVNADRHTSFSGY
ncbi:MAG TPA: hypothetical protein VGJ56_06755 [Reyranella sp.]|jgi:hypothetical protein